MQMLVESHVQPAILVSLPLELQKPSMLHCEQPVFWHALHPERAPPPAISVAVEKAMETAIIATDVA